jgi:outer membrane protein assembly factor BamB
MRKIRTTLAPLVAILLTAPAARADDWPQWMGPRRDDVWRETGIVAKFPTGGLAVKWRAPIDGGYSGPAVADGRVYILDYIATEGDRSHPAPDKRDRLKGKERVLCFSAATGQPQWKYEYDCPYNLSFANGPRCTPTVSGGKVYALGAMGHLHCLEAASGKVVWSRELTKDYKTEVPIWGFAGHPLVDGNKAIVPVGGEGSVLVAFDKDAGKELWRAVTAKEPGYCPPNVIEAGGKRQLIHWNAEAITSVDPETGRLYWSADLVAGYGMAIMAPRKWHDYLFTGGIGSKSVMLKLAADRPAVTEVWPRKTGIGVYPVNSTPIIEGGVIYGVDQTGQLMAAKVETGERLWATAAPTTGGKPTNTATAFLIQNGDRYFLFSETGDLIIARLSPKAYEEVSRTKLIEPTTSAGLRGPVAWSHPAFAGKCVFARNDKELICASLAAE